MKAHQSINRLSFTYIDSWAVTAHRFLSDLYRFSMELTVVDGSGVPEGAILSVKCGAIHCQSALEFDKPIHVPVPKVGMHMDKISVGLLQEVLPFSSDCFLIIV